MKSGPEARPVKRGRVKIALALTWDGARWPTRALPPKARAFLAASSSSAPAMRVVTELLRADRVTELRICWVPRLKGGRDVLNDPFRTVNGRRLKFRASKAVLFDDILGVVYRR